MSCGYKPMTADEQTLLENLMPQDLFSVYSGKNGRCCCGCSGKHTYLTVNRVAAGLNRGYKVDDDELGDRTVKNVLRRLQRAHASGEEVNAGDNHFALVAGQRLRVVYMLESVERKRCQTCDKLHVSTHARGDGTVMCPPCWSAALAYGHLHGMHETIVRECPTCNSADGVF